MEIRDTGTIKGFGVYCVNQPIERHAFLGFYEGNLLRSRDELEQATPSCQRMEAPHLSMDTSVRRTGQAFLWFTSTMKIEARKVATVCASWKTESGVLFCARLPNELPHAS